MKIKLNCKPPIGIITDYSKSEFTKTFDSENMNQLSYLLEDTPSINFVEIDGIYLYAKEDVLETIDVLNSFLKKIPSKRSLTKTELPSTEKQYEILKEISSITSKRLSYRIQNLSDDFVETPFVSICKFISDDKKLIDTFNSLNDRINFDNLVKQFMIEPESEFFISLDENRGVTGYSYLGIHGNTGDNIEYEDFEILFLQGNPSLNKYQKIESECVKLFSIHYYMLTGEIATDFDIILDVKEV